MVVLKELWCCCVVVVVSLCCCHVVVLSLRGDEGWHLWATVAVAVARLWNSLPPDIVACDTLSQFRQELKTCISL